MTWDIAMKDVNAGGFGTLLVLLGINAKYHI